MAWIGKSASYGEVQEELPPKMLKLQGQRVIISAFVDANHAGNKVTRRLNTGIIIYVQNAPILWYSKRQNMVEAATFESEMVVLQICKELIVAMHYKLRIFGVEIDGPANVICDNHGVVKNVSVPVSMLMKKHNAINYHVRREAVAAGILRVGKEDGETNLVDLLTSEGDYGSEEMGLLLLIVLLNWSNSQVLPVACHHGITSHAGLKEIGGFIIWVDLW
jgi:hypothetical protein